MLSTLSCCAFIPLAALYKARIILNSLNLVLNRVAGKHQGAIYEPTRATS